MLLRIAAVVFIFVCTSAAWMILGVTVNSRSDSSESGLRGRVVSTWGAPHEQKPPSAGYNTAFYGMAPLMRGASESMAGRAAILQLLPFSIEESERVTMLAGGFPEVLALAKTRDLWFSSYVQTYLERDIRSITNVRDLATFRRFLALVASRHGHLLNKTDLAAPLGVSVPTIGEWLNVLELTGQIVLVPPYFENFGKRIVKSPELYLVDSGLACHLLGIRSYAELNRSPFLGAIFEGFVAAEILKSQVHELGHSLAAITGVGFDRNNTPEGGWKLENCVRNGGGFKYR